MSSPLLVLGFQQLPRLFKISRVNKALLWDQIIKKKTNCLPCTSSETEVDFVMQERDVYAVFTIRKVFMIFH